MGTGCGPHAHGDPLRSRGRSAGQTLSRMIHDRGVAAAPEGVRHLCPGLLEGLVDLGPELVHWGHGGLVPQGVPQQAEAPNVLDVGAAVVAESVSHMPNTSKGVFGIRRLRVERGRMGIGARSGGWTRTTDSAIMSRLLCP